MTKLSNFFKFSMFVCAFFSVSHLASANTTPAVYDLKQCIKVDTEISSGRCRAKFSNSVGDPGQCKDLNVTFSLQTFHAFMGSGSYTYEYPAYRIKRGSLVQADVPERGSCQAWVRSAASLN